MVLDHAEIRDALAFAWRRSEPGTPQAHEEGGFIVQREDRSLFVIGWQRGLQNEIFVPPHPGGKRGNMTIVATYHTHPNPGPKFQQEPSLTDIRAVRDDPDLAHIEYEGEYVLSQRLIYRILRSGRVEVLGETSVLLGLSNSEA